MNVLSMEWEKKKKNVERSWNNQMKFYKLWMEVLPENFVLQEDHLDFYLDGPVVPAILQA